MSSLDVYSMYSVFLLSSVSSVSGRNNAFSG
jgi:hypothetical protein